MQSVIDFLLEYYVWVLAVLIILLITVIGYLADTKKKKKMREKVMEEEVSTTNNVNGGISDLNGVNQNMNNGFGMEHNNNFNNNMNFGLDNNMANQNYNNMNSFDAQNVSDTSFNQVSNQMFTPPSDSVMNNISNDSFFVPASEQAPKFEPREVVVPTPIPVTPIDNVSIPTPVVEPTPVNVAHEPSVQSGPVIMPNSVYSGSVSNNMNGVVNGMNNRSVTPGVPNIIPNAPVEVQPVTPNVPPTNINPEPIPNVNVEQVRASEMPTDNFFSGNMNQAVQQNPLRNGNAQMPNPNGNFIQNGNGYVSSNLQNNYNAQNFNNGQ